MKTKIDPEHNRLIVYDYFMQLYIHKHIFGTKRHLCIDNHSEYSWVNSIPSDAWIFSAHSSNYVHSINTIMSLMGCEFPKLQNESHVKSFEQICDDELSNIPWHYVLSKKDFSEWCKNIVQEVSNALEIFEGDKYGVTFIEGRALLGSLSRALIDTKKLKLYLKSEKNATVLSTLTSFMPDSAGFANVPVYDRVSTSTGRVIMKAGPQILTLPKRYRDIISSRFRGGSILQVDFVSLEPRVARVISGNSVGDDVYVDISSSILAGRLTREEAKLAVLCALYGVSSARLKNMLGGKADAITVIRKIKEFFGTHALLSNMGLQLAKKGYVENWYGRKLDVENEAKYVWISHFIQSTATDVALIGFNRLMKRVREDSLRVHDVFVIHDAILLDVHPEDEQRLYEIVRGGVELDELGTFPLSVDVISRAQ